MVTLMISIPLFLLAIAGLALGVLVRGRPPGGSCGNCRQCIIREVNQ